MHPSSVRVVSRCDKGQIPIAVSKVILEILRQLYSISRHVVYRIFLLGLSKSARMTMNMYGCKRLDRILIYPSFASVVYRCNMCQIPPHICTSLNNVQFTCSIHGFTKLSSYEYKSSYPVRLKTRLVKFDNEFSASPVCWIAHSDLTMFLISLNQIKDIRKDIE